jgi:hypothetical protein
MAGLRQERVATVRAPLTVIIRWHDVYRAQRVAMVTAFLCGYTLGRLILAAGGEHCHYDSNQGHSELNHDEQGNQLVEDAHFTFSLLTSTPTHNASC